MEQRNLMVNDGIKIYTNGSKIKCGVRSGVFFVDLGVRTSYRCRVFHAEILTTRGTCTLLCDRIIQRDISIFVENQTHRSHHNTFLLVGKCRNEIYMLTGLANIWVWVPVHKNHYGIKRADYHGTPIKWMAVLKVHRLIGIYANRMGSPYNAHFAVVTVLRKSKHCLTFSVSALR